MFLALAFAHVDVIVAALVNSQKVVSLPITMVSIYMMKVYLLVTKHF